MDNINNTDAAVALRAEALLCEKNDIVLFEELGFELKEGEILQVDGENGSGKTSLLRILCGLSYPDEGKVSWYGEDIHTGRAEYLRELVYIAHANAVKSELSLLENLQMNRALCGKPSKLDLQEILEKLALQEYAEIPAGRLSSGQKRRLALARLLLADAKLWVLDEPLNSLDENSKNRITGIILEHVDNGGSVILTSHEQIDWQSRTLRKVEL